MICVICKKKFDPSCSWSPCKLANQYKQIADKGKDEWQR